MAPVLAHLWLEEDTGGYSLNPPPALLGSWGEGKEETLCLGSLGQQDPQGGTEANSCCVDHGAEVGPKMPPSLHRQQGDGLPLWSEPCQRRASSAIDKRLSRQVLAGGCAGSKGEKR